MKNLLFKFTKKSNIPHLIFYGPNGAGKKTAVYAFLASLFNVDSIQLKAKVQTVNVSKTIDLDINLLYSKYHIDINPSEADFHDRVVCQTLIKDFVSTKDARVIMNANGMGDETSLRFKVVIINNAHLLSKDAQAALRRSIEKYTAHCRFILISENLSSIILPLRSRCFGIRCGAPKEKIISSVVLDIAKKEGYVFVSKEICDKIANSCFKNLRRAIMMIQACCYHYYKNQNVENYTAFIPEWERKLWNMSRNSVVDGRTEKIKEIREVLTSMLIYCLHPTIIFEKLTYYLVQVVGEEIKHDVLRCAAFHQLRCTKGSKPIMHLEAFMTRVIAINKIYQNNSLK